MYSTFISIVFAAVLLFCQAFYSPQTYIVGGEDDISVFIGDHNCTHVEIGSQYFTKAASIGKSCVHDKQCIDSFGNHSVCVGLKCNCAKGFVANKNKTKCILQIDQVDIECEETVQCTTILGELSECSLVTNECQCQGSVSVASKDKTICLAIINNLGVPCGESSQCQKGTPGELSECLFQKYDDEKVCSCTGKAYSLPGENECIRDVLKVGDKCGTDSECHLDLGDLSLCIVENGNSSRKVCACNIGESVASMNNQSCLAVVNHIGGECYEDTQCRHGSLRNAVCRENEGCQCFKNHIEIGGVCFEEKHIGSDCEFETECKVVIQGESTCDTKTQLRRNVSVQWDMFPTAKLLYSGRICHGEAKFVGDSCVVDEACIAQLGELSRCIQGTCSCFGVPSENKGTCLKKSTLNETCQEHAQCERETCVCIARSENSDNEKICQCKSGLYIESEKSKGQCVKIANLSSSESRKCFEDIQCTIGVNQFTHCNTGTKLCECRSPAVGRKMSCWEMKVVGSSCSKTEECSATIEGSVECMNNLGKCQCQAGFTSSKDGSACANGALGGAVGDLVTSGTISMLILFNAALLLAN